MAPGKNYITQEYFDMEVEKLRQHVIGRLDKMETNLTEGYRRDVDRIERKSNLQDVGVLIGTIVAAVLGVLGISR